MSEIDDLKKEIKDLKVRVEQVDDWAAGIFQMLDVALIPLLQQNNDLADRILPLLKTIDDEYQRAKLGLPTEMSLEYYEAGSMFYRCFQLLEDYRVQAALRQKKK